MTIDLTLEEFKVVREALMQLKAVKVYNLLLKLDSQVINQSNKKEKTEIAKPVFANGQ